MKPITVVLFLLTSVFCGSIKAQDTIVFRNGEKVLGKVTKVTGREIEYRKANNPDGPVYNAGHDRVSMVIYQNGNKDVFAAPRVQDARPRGNRNERPVESPGQALTKGKVLTSIGAVFLAAGVTTLLVGIITYDLPPMAIGAGLIAGGIPLTIVGSVKIHLARKELNKHKLPNFDSDLGFNPVLGPSVGPTGLISFRAGMGMTLRF